MWLTVPIRWWEAVVMDGVVGQGPCGCWVEKECASMLLQHLQLGFELDVYAPEEYCMLFWCAPSLHLSYRSRS